ncbi:MAG: amino acid permease, partial [Bryobacteraceae bacterium]
MHPHDRKDVEAHSAVFKKELGQWDLVLTQILFIVGLGWIGTAGKLGSGHVIFWLLAITLFYIPSAVVVIHLSRRMPLEGGLYQWAKFGFSEFIGFLVAWNLWLYAMVLMSEVGLQIATNIAYAMGPSFAWIAESKWIIAGCGVAIVGGLMLVSSIGLNMGKWVHNAGALAMIAMFLAIGVLAAIHWLRG